MDGPSVIVADDGKWKPISEYPKALSTAEVLAVLKLANDMGWKALAEKIKICQNAQNHSSK